MGGNLCANQDRPAHVVRDWPSAFDRMPGPPSVRWMDACPGPSKALICKGVKAVSAWGSAVPDGQCYPSKEYSATKKGPRGPRALREPIIVLAKGDAEKASQSELQ